MDEPGTCNRQMLGFIVGYWTVKIRPLQIKPSQHESIYRRSIWPDGQLTIVVPFRSDCHGGSRSAPRQVQGSSSSRSHDDTSQLDNGRGFGVQRLLERSRGSGFSKLRRSGWRQSIASPSRNECSQRMGSSSTKHREEGRYGPRYLVRHFSRLGRRG